MIKFNKWRRSIRTTPSNMGGRSFGNIQMMIDQDYFPSSEYRPGQHSSVVNSNLSFNRFMRDSSTAEAYFRMNRLFRYGQGRSN